MTRGLLGRRGRPGRKGRLGFRGLLVRLGLTEHKALKGRLDLPARKAHRVNLVRLVPRVRKDCQGPKARRDLLGRRGRRAFKGQLDSPAPRDLKVKLAHRARLAPRDRWVRLDRLGLTAHRACRVSRGSPGSQVNMVCLAGT